MLVPFLGERENRLGPAPTMVRIAEIRGDSYEITPVDGADPSVSAAAELLAWNGRVIEAAYMRASGLYRFTTSVSIARSRGAGRVATIEAPETVTCLQRRREFRLPLVKPTTLRRLVSSGAGGPRPVTETVGIVNLSAGGALLTCARRLDAGEIVVLDVPVGKAGDAAEIRAEVIGSTEVSAARADGGGRWHARVQFDNGSSVRLPIEIHEEIVQYVFEQQRIMLRVRKLVGHGDGGQTAVGRKKKARILAAFATWMRAPNQRWKL